jgi:hypothetical protein
MDEHRDQEGEDQEGTVCGVYLGFTVVIFLLSRYCVIVVEEGD